MAKSAATLALAVLGLVFLGQGVGVIPGSFMTGDPTWAVIGGLLLAAAAGLALRNRGRGG